MVDNKVPLAANLLHHHTRRVKHRAAAATTASHRISDRPVVGAKARYFASMNFRAMLRRNLFKQSLQSSGQLILENLGCCFAFHPFCCQISSGFLEHIASDGVDAHFGFLPLVVDTYSRGAMEWTAPETLDGRVDRSGYPKVGNLCVCCSDITRIILAVVGASTSW